MFANATSCASMVGCSDGARLSGPASTSSRPVACRAASMIRALYAFASNISTNTAAAATGSVTRAATHIRAMRNQLRDGFVLCMAAYVVRRPPKIIAGPATERVAL